MRNEEGEYNCFLNVLIQSLWHLDEFRKEMLSSQASAPPGPEGEVAVLQALRQIFSAIDRKAKIQSGQAAAVSGDNEALLAPTDLRDALSSRFQGVGLFQEGEMNDAAEALQSILDCLDRAEGEKADSWVRKLFGLRFHHVMQCRACGKQSLENRWTQLNEQVQAYVVRLQGLVRTLKEEKESDERSCDKDIGGCGTFNKVRYSLEGSLPSLYTVMVSWDSPFPTTEEVEALCKRIVVDLE